MSFLHPNYFPFCPKQNFTGAIRSRFQGPYTLEQAMALYWMVASVSISGKQQAVDADRDYSFTWSGPSKMSDVICPKTTYSYPGYPNTWGWQDEVEVPPESLWDDPILGSTLSEIPGDGRNVIAIGEAYYVAFYFGALVGEGAPVITDSVNGETFVNLEIGDKINVPICFKTTADPFTSTIESLTCTLRSEN